MIEADMSVTAMAFMAENPNAGPQPGDEAVHARFYLYPHKNEAKTLEAGRPIYEDREYVRIAVAGDKDNIIERPARVNDKLRFPRQYEAFKRGEGEVLIGTPLTTWPAMSRSQVEELAFFGVRTVEQLAEMADAQIQKFMGGRQLRDRARAFIATAKGEAPLLQMQAELESRDSKIAALERRLDELMAEKEDE
jgi:hypothetical protein